MNKTQIIDNIVCKSAPVDFELQVRAQYGFSKVELHLEKHDIENMTAIKKTFQNILNSKLEVVGVHAPLYHKEELGTIVPETISNSLDFRFTQILAQKIGCYYHKNIYVVLHVREPLIVLKQNIPEWKSIIDYFRHSIIEFPNVIYTLENVTPTSEINTFVPGAQYENVEICEALREYVNDEYFYTTLDTCHLLTTQRVMTFLKSHGLLTSNTFSVEEAIKINAPYINNIHLSYVKSLGFFPNEHGISHDLNEDISKQHLTNCMCSLKNTNINHFITLEVAEEHYENPVNADIQRNNIYVILNEQNI